MSVRPILQDQEIRTTWVQNITFGYSFVQIPRASCPYTLVSIPRKFGSFHEVQYVQYFISSLAGRWAAAAVAK